MSDEYRGENPEQNTSTPPLPTNQSITVCLCKAGVGVGDVGWTG